MDRGQCFVMSAQARAAKERHQEELQQLHPLSKPSSRPAVAQQPRCLVEDVDCKTEFSKQQIPFLNSSPSKMTKDDKSTDNQPFFQFPLLITPDHLKIPSSGHLDLKIENPTARAISIVFDIDSFGFDIERGWYMKDGKEEVVVPEWEDRKRWYFDPDIDDKPRKRELSHQINPESVFYLRIKYEDDFIKTYQRRIDRVRGIKIGHDEIPEVFNGGSEDPWDFYEKGDDDLYVEHKETRNQKVFEKYGSKIDEISDEEIKKMKEEIAEKQIREMLKKRGRVQAKEKLSKRMKNRMKKCVVM
uniref:MSP domain-containing protein n=2 Tax=Caenorhabditis tropicalis TaxID=1561998 RepID=A0A1I7UPI5_9PELO